MNPSDFESLKPFLSMEAPASTRSELGRSLGITESTLNVTIHRFRRQYRDLVRSEVAETVSNPDEFQAEMAHLLEIISKR